MTVRIVAAVVFGLAGVVFALLFVLITLTKLMSGQWLGYLGMAINGLGCAACVVATRQFLRSGHRARLSMPEVGSRR